MSETHEISDGLRATVSAAGAELQSLRDRPGRELLWQAGPLWPNHSPVLFPIVGQLADDELSVDGHTTTLTRHGFARRRTFTWQDRGPTSCSLALQDDPATRAVYPFPFRLVLTYRIESGALTVDYALNNPGAEILPASLGAHPAFRWPLADGAQTGYRIEFAEGRPTPIAGRRLDLDPALFADDAIIMLAPNSRSLRYLGPGAGLEFRWTGFPQLGLWQKHGADFICLEPWHGYSTPSGWTGDFRDKPGLMLIPPGETRHFSWTARPLTG